MEALLPGPDGIRVREAGGFLGASVGEHDQRLIDADEVPAVLTAKLVSHRVSLTILL
jgi:hypothetical protein